MGCQKVKCAGCSQPTKACQLANGLCPNCHAKKQKQ